VTGATLIAEDLGKKLENAELEDLGRAMINVTQKGNQSHVLECIDITRLGAS